MAVSRLSEIEEPHPQPPPISKVYPFLPPVAGGLRGVRGGGYDVRRKKMVILAFRTLIQQRR